MAEFRMPSLGADMDEGTVTEWLVHPGDAVHRGDIVAVVDTDKADIDVEIFEDGVVEEILVPAGERVAVGTPLAVIGDGAPRTPVATGAAIEPAEAAITTAPKHTVREASPVVQRLAHHLGVDLQHVAGTGPEGAITRADVEAAAAVASSSSRDAAAEPSVPPPEADRSLAMRDAIAKLMARSKREIPHYYLATDVDFSACRAWLDETNAKRSVTDRVVPAALQLKAVALACVAVPEVNGFWIDEHFVPADHVHLGVAISLRGGGLIAPALHDAKSKTLDEVMRELRDLVARTRSGRLRSSEMADATLTVTNLGDQGVDRVFGVIYPPQVALVGFGRIREQPVAENGMVGARPVVSVSLAADHRASDGARGARFLSRIDELLQDPSSL